MANALLLAAFDFSAAHADEFHDWYDLEHIPERRAVRGVWGVRTLDRRGRSRPFQWPPTISIRSTCCVARPTHPSPTATYRSGRSA